MTDAPAALMPIPPQTLPALLREQVARFGDRALLSVAGRHWSHRDAVVAGAAHGAALRRAGVGRGDRVAVMCANRIALLEVLLGCGWIGAVSVPIKTAAMGPQIQSFLADSGARLLVSEAQWLARLQTADLSQTSLERVWLVGASLPESARADGREPYAEASGAVEPVDLRPGEAPLEGYGSTETNFVIATAPDSPRRGVMGWQRPGFDARVADEDDVELPDGEAGELLLRADARFAFATGYFKLPDKTVEAWRNLWFHTGDRVVRDADGAFRFIDRIKDAIRRRGETISSYEVEQVLLSHPAVAAAAVFPVRSELAEDEVMAALVARPDQAVEPRELAIFCAARLPYFAVPRYIDSVAELPCTENGKVQKYRLRERGVTATAWDRQPAAHGSDDAAAAFDTALRRVAS